LDQPSSLILYFDTNILFSALGLHESPSNSVVNSLMELISLISNDVNIEICIIPTTLDESRRVLRSIKERVRGYQLSPKIAHATLETPGLSGISKKYIKEYARLNYSLSPDDYFNPYIDNLIDLAKGKGIELSSLDISSYKNDKKVIADVEYQLKFEKTNFKNMAKGRAQLEHDMILWHIVNNRRPDRYDSPLDAASWIVTLDSRFLGFDRFKLSNSNNTIPVCIHPITLIQLLQFWVPRSEKFAKALFDNTKLPLINRKQYDLGEFATVKILNALSRAEVQVNEFDSRTITKVLMNKVLAQRLDDNLDDENEINNVRQALIDEQIETEKITLSDRERNVILFLAKGNTDREISDLIDIQVSSVKNIVKSLLAKFSVNNRTEIIERAIELDLLENDEFSKRRD
jgi:DNA-binding CsgD family transcriptional regulator